MANPLLTSLLTKASSNWGLPESEITNAINRMAFHESKGVTDAVQVLDDGSQGRGKGLYQYETDESTGFPNYENIQGGAHTAINRIIEYNKSQGDKYDISFINQLLPQEYDVSGDAYKETIHSGPNPENLYDFSKLSEEDQFIMVLIDKLGDPTANMGKYDTDGDKKLSDKELAEFHADEHWAGYEGAETLTPTKKGKIEKDAFIKKASEDYQFYKP